MAGVNAAASQPCRPAPDGAIVPLRDCEGTGPERIAIESNESSCSRFSPYDLWGCDTPHGGFIPLKRRAGLANDPWAKPTGH